MSIMDDKHGKLMSGIALMLIGGFFVSMAVWLAMRPHDEQDQINTITESTTGKRYIIKHNGGDLYTVWELEAESKQK